MVLEATIRRGVERVRYFIENTGMIKSQVHADDDRDFQILYNIQPTCGVKFNDNYTVLGDGYMACIHVYSAPESLMRNWMFNIFNKPNVIATIDIETLDNEEVKENINRSISEYESRIEDNRGKRSIEKEAVDTYQRLDELLDEVNVLGNSLKALHIRMYVYAHTFEELQDNVMYVEQAIDEEGFSRHGVNINEEGFAYRSFFLPISIQQKTISARKGIPSPAHTTAYGLPFHYVGWKDKRGFYFGDTPDTAGYGPVFFYPYTIDRYRTSYDGLVIGKKGTGKSTTLKMLIEWQLATGNRVRIIDVTPEFGELTRKYGGIVIKMDGEERLNPLEILRMDDDDSKNYMKHIAKMGVMFQLKNPQAEQDVVELYKLLLKEIYIEMGILKVENGDTVIYDGITGLPSEVYPIFSDVQRALERKIDKLEQEKDTKESSRLNINKYLTIKSTIDDIVGNYGAIFNGHTTITNLMDADIICYDISTVAQMEDKEVFDMQLFNVLTMAYDSCMNIGIEMKKKWDNKEISEDDIIHHCIYIDECHKTINSQKLFAVKRMLDIMRQDRKYFIGVWLATQNIADMFPKSRDIADDLVTLFSLCQYKLIFKQDEKALELIETVFGGQITPNQRARIPYFGKRDCLLNFDIITLEMTCKELSPEKLRYYGGGA